MLKSQTFASPLSFVGSTRRLIAWATKTGRRNPRVSVAAWIVALAAMLFAWVFLLFWYVIIFGVFGIFVIPFRLMRRSSRKSLHVQRTTLATQQAIYQQQVAMTQRMGQQTPPWLGGERDRSGPSGG